MIRRLLLACFLLTLLLPAAGLAQDADKPTIAFLRYRNSSAFELARIGFLDVMQAYGFINALERVALEEEDDLDGERINVFWGDAGGDLPTANILVEEALDRGATLLATLSTPVTQIAVGVTDDMETPVPVIFSIVGAPYTAGIAEAPCVKPDHVAGTKAHTPRHLTVPLLFLQDPDAKTIGMLVNAAEANSVNNLNLITAAAEDNGMSVESVAIAGANDVPVAAATLVDKGVDAIYLTGYVDSVGLPGIIGPAMEAGVPIVGMSPGTTRRGATIGAGFNSYYREGMIQGRIIANYLNGDVDISSLAINEIPGLTVALNLDIGAEFGFQFSPEMLARADYVIQNGESTENLTPPGLPDVSFEELREADLEFLAGLRCTDEMIAQQQAELDAGA